MRQKVIFSLLLMSFTASVFGAGNATNSSPAGMENGIDQVLNRWTREIRQRHPRLLSLRQRIAAQKRRVKPAGILPDPILGVTFRTVGDPIPLTTLGEEMMSTAGLTLQQPIPWKGKLGTRRNLAEQMVAVWESDYRVGYWELIGELKRRTYELAFQQENLSILQESRDLLNQLISIAEALYSVGKGTQGDVLRAYTERSRLDEKIALTDQRRHTLVQQIREQFLVDPEAEVPRLHLPVSGPDLPDEVRLTALLDRDAPRVAAILARIEVQQQRKRLRYLDRYPDFTIRAGWFSRGRLPDIYEVGVGLNLPIFAGAKQKPLYEAEVEDLEALNRQLEDIRFQLRWKLQDAFIQARTARRLVDLYRDEILPQAQTDFESTLDNYQTGRVDFLNVMDRWLRWLDFRVGFYRRLAEYYQSLATLEEITGRPFTAPPSGGSSASSRSLAAPPLHFPYRISDTEARP